MSKAHWERFCTSYWEEPTLGFSLDWLQMDMEPSYLEKLTRPLQAALQEMNELEAGAIANADEQRMVGHYWLRDASLAPEPALQQAIEDAKQHVQTFANAIHQGDIKPEKSESFKHFVLVGIGGSSLGPILLHDAMRSSQDAMQGHFVDNTDPDGIDRLVQTLGDALKETLVLVISKSGGTKETRNGMLEMKHAYEQAGLDFGRHAVAVTGEGSKLEKIAEESGMLATFPMWDWVGGRTSLFSAVGLLPAALQGVDIDALLAGAAAMDVCTRRPEPRDNPAALMASLWYFAGEGRGLRDLVVLPYKDRLLLMSRYLQQLIMESLGKEFDRDGRPVHQGLTVYGNKGSTDQHAFVQQLREGPSRFFVNFIEVRKDRSGPSIDVEDGVTSGDFLLGFLMGTREALHQTKRASLTLSIEEVNAHSLGALIALYERTVGLYASLININAYHQPGVEAGKKAAQRFLTLQQQIVSHLKETPETAHSIIEIAAALEAQEMTQAIFYILEHLASNQRCKRYGDAPSTRTYQHMS